MLQGSLGVVIIVWTKASVNEYERRNTLKRYAYMIIVLREFAFQTQLDFTDDRCDDGANLEIGKLTGKR